MKKRKNSMEDFLVELVCNARWVGNLCTAQLKMENSAVNESETQSANVSRHQEYTADIELAAEMLVNLGKSMNHIEVVSELPASCVKCLCRGVAYLLCAEILLGQSPPTMHHYLRQSLDRRDDKASQTQLLVVRWFITAGIISPTEMLQVIYGDEVQAESYEDEYQLHQALAACLADPETFYVGAHIMVMRGLLTWHCTHFLTIDDIVGHVALLLPPEDEITEDPKTLDDALLVWLRTAMSLITPTLMNRRDMAPDSPTSVTLQELSFVEDLYLHTNDGRILSLVVHQYHPELLPVKAIHVLDPLTVWQRQDNWSNIILAAEKLGLWIGIFADELVSHGFSCLQMHVLRIVLELFAVLAMDSENRFSSLCSLLDADTTFVKIRQSLNLTGYESLGNPKGEGASTLEDDTLIDRPLSERQARATTNEIEGASTQVSPTPPQSGRSAQGGAVHRHQTEVASKPSSGAGASSRSAPPPPLEDDEEYNVILTGMFLQGVSMPIRKQAEAAPQSLPPQATAAHDVSDQRTDVTGGDESTFLIHRPQNTSEQPPTQLSTSSLGQRGPQSEDDVNMGSASASPSALVDDRVHQQRPTAAQQGQARPVQGHAQQQQQANDQMPSGASTGPGIGLDSSSVLYTQDQSGDLSYVVDPAVRLFQSQLGTDPTRSVSPDLQGSEVRRSRTLAGTSQGLDPLRASLQHFHPTTGSSTNGAAGKPASSKGVLVQGSMDTDGIRSLLSQLVELSDEKKTQSLFKEQDPAKATMQLKHAFAVQQASIKQLVAQLQQQLQGKEMQTIAQHLRNSKQMHPRRATTETGTSMMSFAARPKPMSPGALEREATWDQTATRSDLNNMSGLEQPSGDSSLCSGADSTYVQRGREPTQILSQPPVQAPAQAHRQPTEQRAASRESDKKEVSPTLTEGHVVASGPVRAPSEPLRPVKAPPTAPGQKGVRKGGEAFEISLGAAAGGGQGKGVEGPERIPQLQKLKERHEERRQQQKLAPLLPALAKRNNKTVISNALRYACLPGQINKKSLDNALAIVNEDEGTHFVVLLKDEFNHVFRGLYAERGVPGVAADADGSSGPEHAHRLVRVFGSGPVSLPVPNADTNSAVKFFRFDTGSKNFAAFTAKEFDNMTDAVAWCGGKIPKGK